MPRLSRFLEQNIKVCLAVLTMFLLTSLTEAAPMTDRVAVNIARAEWGTLITASSQAGPQHGPANLADGSAEQGHGWLSQDSVALPQQVTFTFEQEQLLSRVKLVQAAWYEDMYRTKDFSMELSRDGKSWKKVAGGKLENRPNATAEITLDAQPAKALRVVITGSYRRQVQICGLGEVEIFALVPKGQTPPYAGATPDIQWQTMRGRFRMSFTLDPPMTLWRPLKAKETSKTTRQYQSGQYRLAMKEEKRGEKARVIHYELSRTDGQPFKVQENLVECKTSYAGVYKMSAPFTMAQQNYKIDLPFRLEGTCNGLFDTPVVWMQQTDGRNTLTFGMLDQVPGTTMDGSTYDTGNGGEAPGIANSYVRATMKRGGTALPAGQSFKDGLYVNADPAISWHEALLDYSKAVDQARDFQARPIGTNALNPMWHSWYAHADQIDEAQIRRDAKDAAALGVKTIEIDAGWNMSANYDFANEGCHEFDPKRFPHGKEMIGDLHKMDLKVILHVAPLLMGKNSKTYGGMKDCLIKLGGKDDAHLDPRYKKVQIYLLKAWEKLFREYGVDGLWYDFLEIPGADAPDPGAELISPDLTEAYTMLMQALYRRALELNPDAVIILRRGSANLNAKTFCTHVWPMDTPQDYNMNRRDIVYMKSYGAGVLTHACCTSWAISESDTNVARQMASVVLAGVPAFSVKLAESPRSHNEIIKAWLKFYEANKRALVLGRMTPLLPTPPSAAIRIEGEKEAFFGFFEALPGLIELTRPASKITLVNAFSSRTVTRLEGVKGDYQAQIFDQTWKPVARRVLKNDGQGININLSGPTACFEIVLTRR